MNQRSLKSTRRNLGVNPYRALKRNGIRVGTSPSVEPDDVSALIAALIGLWSAFRWRHGRCGTRCLTCSVPGGVSPLGRRKAMRTLIDASAEGFTTLLVSAGRRGLAVELAPADLAALCTASYAPIAVK